MIISLFFYLGLLKRQPVLKWKKKGAVIVGTGYPSTACDKRSYRQLSVFIHSSMHSEYLTDLQQKSTWRGPYVA